MGSKIIHRWSRSSLSKNRDDRVVGKGDKRSCITAAVAVVTLVSGELSREPVTASSYEPDLGGATTTIIGVHAELNGTRVRLTGQTEGLLTTRATDDVQTDGWGGRMRPARRHLNRGRTHRWSWGWRNVERRDQVEKGKKRWRGEDGRKRREKE